MSEELHPPATDDRANLELLLRCAPEDFDGHTEFHRLTPLQRLVWLDEAVAFIGAAKRMKSPATPVTPEFE